MSKNLPIGFDNNLVWWPELGMGWHPAPPMSYEQDYWDKYVKYDDTKMGEALTRFRLNFVRKYWQGEVVDIGIGAGRFVQESGGKGFDVNKSAVKWLKNNNCFCDPYDQQVMAITCWDSLEHIPDPVKLLDQVTKWVFVSIPVFEDANRVHKSKHFRPGEHIWYFSERGLIKWMAQHGFRLVGHSDEETKLGREDIMTYAFCRD